MNNVQKIFNYLSQPIISLSPISTLPTRTLKATGRALGCFVTTVFHIPFRLKNYLFTPSLDFQKIEIASLKTLLKEKDVKILELENDKKNLEKTLTSSADEQSKKIIEGLQKEANVSKQLFNTYRAKYDLLRKKTLYIMHKAHQQIAHCEIVTKLLSEKVSVKNIQAMNEILAKYKEAKELDPIEMPEQNKEFENALDEIKIEDLKYRPNPDAETLKVVKTIMNKKNKE